MAVALAGSPPLCPRRAAPAHTWSHPETIHLIDSYAERWIALKRGPMKAHQWDAVASSVAARSGPAGAKTGTQCRHKIEKLRKRYRAERGRVAAGLPSAWPYYRLMDRMEIGALPVAGDGEEDGGLGESEGRGDFGPPRVSGCPSSGRKRKDFDADESEERVYRGGGPRVSAERGDWKRRDVDVDEGEDDDEDEDSSEDEERERPVMSGLAGVAMGFGEGLMRLESRRMEVMRELERDWMEMERRRVEMVRRSQQSLVEMIANVFSTNDRSKRKAKV